jgi:hypothetical protein
MCTTACIGSRHIGHDIPSRFNLSPHSTQSPIWPHGAIAAFGALSAQILQNKFFSNANAGLPSGYFVLNQRFFTSMVF